MHFVSDFNNESKADALVRSLESILRTHGADHAISSLGRLMLTYGAPDGHGRAGGITNEMVERLEEISKTAHKHSVIKPDFVEKVKDLKKYQDERLTDAERIGNWYRFHAEFIGRYPIEFLQCIQSHRPQESDFARSMICGHSKCVTYFVVDRKGPDVGSSSITLQHTHS